MRVLVLLLALITLLSRGGAGSFAWATDNPRAAADLCAAVPSLIEEVARHTALPRPNTVRCEVVDDVEFLRHHEVLFARNGGSARGPFDEAVLRALGLLPGDYPFLRCIVRASVRDASALYDPFERAIFIAGSRDVDEKVLIHELVHAFQDQELHLSAYAFDPRASTDAQISRAIVLEGHAIFTQSQVGEKGGARVDRARRPRTGDGGAFSATPADSECELPRYLEWLLGYPYDLGPLLMGALNERGGEAAMLRALRDPPRSVQEVVRLYSFQRGGEGRKGSLPKLPENRRVGIIERERTLIDTLGLLFVRAVAQLSYPKPLALRIAAGWRDDVVTVRIEPGPEMAALVTWRVEFEDPESALSFGGSLRRILEADLDMELYTSPRVRVELQGVLQGELVVNGSTVTYLRRLSLSTPR